MVNFKVSFYSRFESWVHAEFKAKWDPSSQSEPPVKQYGSVIYSPWIPRILHSCRTQGKCQSLRGAHSCWEFIYILCRLASMCMKKIRRNTLILSIQLLLHRVVLWLLSYNWKLTFLTHVGDFNPLSSTQHQLLPTTIYHPHIIIEFIYC